MKDEGGFFWNANQVPRAERILNQLHFTQIALLRDIIGVWCRTAGVPFNEWPDHREWWGVVDVVVSRLQTDLRLQSGNTLSHTEALKRACAHLQLDYENLRHRWGRVGGPDKR